MRASASAIDFVFSLSLVSHQHAILSYISSSSSASFSSCFNISFSKVITFETGRFLAASSSNFSEEVIYFLVFLCLFLELLQ